MKTLLLLLLIPSLSLAEDSPFISSARVPTAQERAAGLARQRQFNNFMAFDSAVEGSKNQASPPTIIYHARGAYDVSALEVHQDLMKIIDRNYREPNVVYEIGENGRRY